MKQVTFMVFMILSFHAFAQEAGQLKSQVRHSIDELRDFISIPNDALDHADINRNITWLTKKFNERGFNTSSLPTEGESLSLLHSPWRMKSQPFFFTCTLTDNRLTHPNGTSQTPMKWY